MEITESLISAEFTLFSTFAKTKKIMKVTASDIREVFLYYIRRNNDLFTLIKRYCIAREKVEEKDASFKFVFDKVDKTPNYFRSVANHVEEYRKTNDMSYFDKDGAIDTEYLLRLAKFFVILQNEFQQKSVKNLTKTELEETFTSISDNSKTNYISLIYKWNNLDKFIGRERKLNELFNRTQKNDYIIVNGIRGIGKTSLVQAFLTQHEDYYKNIAWITVIDGIRKSMLRTLSFSDKIKFSEPQSDDSNIIVEQYKCLLNELSEFEGKNLIIFDNANNAAEISEIINDFSSCLPGWKVVFTTNSNIKTPKPLQLGELSTKDARSLFLSYYNDSDVDENEAKQAFKFLETYGEKPINILLSKIKNIPLVIELLAKVDIADEFISLEDLTKIVNSINDLNNDQLKVAVQPRIKHPNAYNLSPEEMTPFVYIKTIFAKDLKILDHDQKQYLYLFTILPSLEIPSDDLIYLLDTNKTHFISIMRKLKAWLNYDAQTNSFRMDELHQFAIREILSDQSPSLLDLQQIASRIKTKTEKLKYNQTLIAEYNRFLGYREVIGVE